MCVNSRDIDLLVLVLVEVPLHKLVKVAQAHLPRLTLFDLHLVEPAVAYPVPDMLLEPVVEERTTAEATRPDGRLFDPQRFERYYLIRNQTRSNRQFLHPSPGPILMPPGIK